MGKMRFPFRTVIPAVLPWGNYRAEIKAFLDSGAVDCFVDIEWACKVRLPVQSLTRSHPILSLDGHPLG